MSVPNNKTYVERLLNRIGIVRLTVSAGQVEAVRLSLLPLIWSEFPNKEDWGVLVKTERDPDFIPSDILWYKPTGEHVDVITSTDPNPQGLCTIKVAWVNQGINERQRDGRWKFMSMAEALSSGMIKPLEAIIDPPKPKPEEPPIKPEIPQPTNTYIVDRINELTREIIDLKQVINKQSTLMNEMKDAIILLLNNPVTDTKNIQFPTYTARILGQVVKLTPDK